MLDKMKDLVETDDDMDLIEALEKADEIVKKNMYGGPYYNVSEVEDE